MHPDRQVQDDPSRTSILSAFSVEIDLNTEEPKNFNRLRSKSFLTPFYIHEAVHLNMNDNQWKDFREWDYCEESIPDGACALNPRAEDQKNWARDEQLGLQHDGTVISNRSHGDMFNRENLSIWPANQQKISPSYDLFAKSNIDKRNSHPSCSCQQCHRQPPFSLDKHPAATAGYISPLTDPISSVTPRTGFLGARSLDSVQCQSSHVFPFFIEHYDFAEECLL